MTGKRAEPYLRRQRDAITKLSQRLGALPRTVLVVARSGSRLSQTDSCLAWAFPLNPRSGFGRAHGETDRQHRRSGNCRALARGRLTVRHEPWVDDADEPS